MIIYILNLIEINLKYALGKLIRFWKNIFMNKSLIIKVFSDYVCPWCYLGNHRFKKLQERFKITTQLIHFPLHPETPINGLPLVDLFKISPEQLKEKNNQMIEIMNLEGLPFKSRSHTYNSRLAQEVGAWAANKTKNNLIHDKFFEAYFVNGQNIADIEVIFDIIKSIGLNTSEAYNVINKRTFKQKIDTDWETSYQSGVTGVPTFILNKNYLVGAQSYEHLKKLIEEAGGN